MGRVCDQRIPCSAKNLFCEVNQVFEAFDRALWYNFTNEGGVAHKHKYVGLFHMWQRQLSGKYTTDWKYVYVYGIYYQIHC